MDATERLHDFDASDFLGSEEEIADHLAAALETNDLANIAHARDVATRAKRMIGSVRIL